MDKLTLLSIKPFSDSQRTDAILHVRFKGFKPLEKDVNLSLSVMDHQIGFFQGYSLTRSRKESIATIESNDWECGITKEQIIALQSLLEESLNITLAFTHIMDIVPGPKPLSSDYSVAVSLSHENIESLLADIGNLPKPL